MSDDPKVSRRIHAKLKGKHSVTLEEVRQCFSNMEGAFLEDSREDHKTDPATLWFIAETDKGRLLKVCFVPGTDGDDLAIKTSYEPNDEETRIYDKYGKKK